MTRSTTAKLFLAAVTALGAGPAAPAALATAPGNGGAPAGSAPAGTPSSPPPSDSSTTPASTPASGEAVGTPVQLPAITSTTGVVAMQVRTAALLGRSLHFRGSVRRAYAGSEIVLQRYDAASASWVTATTTTADRRGRFYAGWVTNVTGHMQLRAIAMAATVARARPLAPAASSPAQVTVYKPALATIFGPGFYGKQTACGQTLQPGTVGVANRTLPCGTLIEFQYGGRIVAVPVIDRGPYANGANWDLTEAAAQALGATETITVGALRIGALPNNASLGAPAGSSTGSTGSTGATGQTGASGGATAG